MGHWRYRRILFKQFFCPILQIYDEAICNLVLIIEEIVTMVFTHHQLLQLVGSVTFF